MNKLLIKSAWLIITLFASAAQASFDYTSTTHGGALNFDDLSGTTAPLVNGYQGLDWNNFSFLNAPWWVSQVGPNGAMTVAQYDSLPNVAVNTTQAPASFWTNDLSNFTHVHFNIGSVYQDNLFVTITGYEYNGTTPGAALDSMTVDLTSPFARPTGINIGWTNVNYLQFTAVAGTQDPGVTRNGAFFAIDVPEPEQYTLLLPGLLLLAATSKKRQQDNEHLLPIVG